MFVSLDSWWQVLAGFDGRVVVVDSGRLLAFVSTGDVVGLSLLTVGSWLPFVSTGDVAGLSLSTVGSWLPFVSTGDVAGLLSSTVGGRWRARALVTWRSCAVCLVLSEGEGVGGWHYSPALSNAGPCRCR